MLPDDRNVRRSPGLTLAAVAVLLVVGAVAAARAVRVVERPRLGVPNVPALPPPVGAPTSPGVPAPGDAVLVLALEGAGRRAVDVVVRARGGALRRADSAWTAAPGGGDSVLRVTTPAAFVLDSSVVALEVRTVARGDAVLVGLGLAHRRGWIEIEEVWGRSLELERVGGRWVRRSAVHPLEPGAADRPRR